MYKHLYSRFLNANPERLHFAAHSHHYWPDVTREAQLRYWDDSARLADKKWDYLFSKIIPKARQYVANWLNAGQPDQIVFAPNTHELVCRLLSCFPPDKPMRVLSTDSEFYSFGRQAKRLVELGQLELETVAVKPFESFETRLLERIDAEPFDLIYVSSIFFNCGLGLPKLDPLVEASRRNSGVLVMDGYHSFGALPVDLSSFANDLFYLGGGYKYVQSGEGVCFMHAPKSFERLPANTGWFAEFEDLDAHNPEAVSFAPDAMRFAGATFDPTGIYRFNAVMEMLEAHQLDAARIHDYVGRLQQVFLDRLDSGDHCLIHRGNLVDSEVLQRGHFFAFDLATNEAASQLGRKLAAEDVICDVRDSRIRFGFGLYQDEQDVDQFFQRLARVSAG